jgi:pyruvate dehydrogenase (quinone)
VDNPDNLADAWDEALSADRPVVFEAMTDGNVPTLPPHITLEQAKNFATSLLKGDPNESGIIKQAVKGMMDSIMPGR